MSGSLPPLTDPGVPSYVNDGYVQHGYQQYYSSVSGVPPGTPPVQGVPFSNPVNPPRWPILPPTLPPESCPPLDSAWAPGPIELFGDEMSYTPPRYEPNDDGLRFPAAPEDLILRQAWHGIASTMNPGNIQLYNDILGAVIRDAIASALASASGSVSTPESSVSVSISVDVPAVGQIGIAVETAVIQKMLQGTGLWYELVLKPLTNGPFMSAYVVSTTPLIIPQTIDLSA